MSVSLSSGSCSCSSSSAGPFAVGTALVESNRGKPRKLARAGAAVPLLCGEGVEVFVVREPFEAKDEVGWGLKSDSDRLSMLRVMLLE